MNFTYGATSLDFYPMAHTMETEDRTQLHTASDGSVISATNGGLSPRRRRRLTLRLTSSDLTSFKSLYDSVEADEFLFTDSAGASFDVRWLGAFDASEDAYSADGHYRLTIDLLLVTPHSLASYSNTDVSQMSAQVSGSYVLYFPLSYVPTLERADQPTASRLLAPGLLSTDPSRYTARQERTLRFASLPDEFMSKLELYYATIMLGAAKPFTLTHFRDGSESYRWVGGLNAEQDDGLNWSCTMRLRQEV